jgi:anti-anti-sigma factor
VIQRIRRFLRMLREGPEPFPCRVEPLESERGFRLSGELDLFNAEAVKEVLAPELHGTLVLDMAGVTFIDDSGLGMLVGTLKRLTREGGSLVIRNPSAQIRRVLEITGIERVPGLTIEPDAGRA